MKDIVDNLKIKGKAGLKIDTEGCEYRIIGDSSSETIQKFDVMHIEYHHGYKDLVERLKSEGYEVEFGRPHCDFAGLYKNRLISGDIYAERHA